MAVDSHLVSPVYYQTPTQIRLKNNPVKAGRCLSHNLWLFIVPLPHPMTAQHKNTRGQDPIFTLWSTVRRLSHISYLLCRVTYSKMSTQRTWPSHMHYSKQDHTVSKAVFHSCQLLIWWLSARLGLSSCNNEALAQQLGLVCSSVSTLWCFLI